MLKDILALKMAQKGEEFRYKDLSRESEITYQTILKIKDGNTTNPGVYTVANIADVLACSIEELIGRPTKKSKTKSIKITNHPLLLEIILFTFDQIKTHNHHIYSLDLFNTIMNIYSYSQEQNQIDKKFAKWCIENQLLEKT